MRNIKVTMAGIIAAALMFNAVVSAESWIDKAKREKPNADRFFKETNLGSGFHKDRPGINAEELGKRLDATLGGMKGYNYGDESGDVANLRTTMESVHGNKDLQRVAEKRFVAYLQTDASYQAKQVVCRELRKVGSGECVTVLGEMLVDPKFSDMARYAMESNLSAGIDEAFIAAMDKTNGKFKTGIINSIGVRRSSAATDKLATLVEDNDAMVAGAAIAALGQIGTDSSARILSRAWKKVSKDRRINVSQALIRCARRIAVSDKSAADKIYEELANSKVAWRIRVAAVKGMLELEPAGRKLSRIVDDVVNALVRDDAEERAFGVAVVESLPDDGGITRKIAGVIRKCQPYVQEQMIYSLGNRRDSEALSAVSEAVNSDNVFVRMASLYTIGKIGNTSSIVLLANKSAKGAKEEKDIALTSLRRIQGAGIDDAIIELINSGPAGSRADVIYAVGQRGMYRAYEDLYRIASREDNSRIRKQAILALGFLARGEDLDKLIELAVHPNNTADSSAIEKTILMVLGKIKDKNAQARPVIAALKKAPDDAKPALLKLLSKCATQEAFEMVSVAARSSNRNVSDAAIRSLSDWPDPVSVDLLYSIASGSSNPVHRVLALRGYVRMAQLTDNPMDVYLKAMKLAKRPEDIKLVLSGLGNDDSYEAIELAKKYMKQDQFRSEAFITAINISSRYCWSDYLGTKRLMESIMSQTRNDSIRDKAGKVIEDMNRLNGNIFVWNISELYKVDGKNGEQVFNMGFDVENDINKAKWSKFACPGGQEDIDLEKLRFGEVDECSVYLFSYVYSPIDQDVRVHMSADDKIKAWANGAKVENDRFRFHKGKNTFMVKVGDNSGGWRFRCRLTKPDGGRIENLKFTLQ